MLINPRKLAALEDALALAHYRERQTSTSRTVTAHDDVRALLGLERG